MTPTTQRTVVCLCGSTRFRREWEEEYERLSRLGHIVLLCAPFPPRWHLQFEAPGLKRELDALHLSKIELADEVFILNVDGYIGESTQRELQHAKQLGKKITLLVPA